MDQREREREKKKNISSVQNPAPFQPDPHPTLAAPHPELMCSTSCVSWSGNTRHATLTPGNTATQRRIDGVGVGVAVVVVMIDILVSDDFVDGSGGGRILVLLLSFFPSINKDFSILEPQ